MIRIKSKKPTFRRCGITHQAGWMEYPDDRFSEAALAILKAEPMLIVEVIAKKEDDPYVEYMAMTVADLKKLLDEKGIEYPGNAKKADLVVLAKEFEEA